MAGFAVLRRRKPSLSFARATKPMPLHEVKMLEMALAHAPRHLLPACTAERSSASTDAGFCRASIGVGIILPPLLSTA